MSLTFMMTSYNVHNFSLKWQHLYYFHPFCSFLCMFNSIYSFLYCINLMTLNYIIYSTYLILWSWIWIVFSMVVSLIQRFVNKDIDDYLYYRDVLNSNCPTVDPQCIHNHTFLSLYWHSVQTIDTILFALLKMIFI